MMLKALMFCLVFLAIQQPTERPQLTIKISNIEKLKGDIKIGTFHINLESSFQVSNDITQSNRIQHDGIYDVLRTDCQNDHH